MRIRLGAQRIDLESGVITGGASGDHLTPIERRLLRRLAEAPGALTADQLLADVWGYAPGVNTRTLLTTVSRVRKKLEADPAQPAWLVTARGLGDPSGNAYRLRWSADVASLPPVPPPLTATWGRAAEIARLDRHHAGSARLITLLGPGGIGKTHLARVWASRHPGEVRWLDAEAADGVDALAAAVGARLGARDLGRDAVGRVGRLLAEEPPGWWVLDNVEQIDGLAPVLLQWLDDAPGQRFLLTTRRPLVVPGEVVVELGPLAEPDAVALLLAGCEARDATVRPEDGAMLAAIARAVDGHPLALELATAWVGWIPLAEVRKRVETDAAGLSTPTPAGRRSLAACFARSWDQLQPGARAALARATALPGGFDLPLARRVLADTPEAAEVALAELRAHSLSRLEGARFRVLVPIREFAAAADPAEALLGEQRAADALAEALGRDLDPTASTHEPPVDWLAAWDADVPNLRHLLDRLLAHADDGRAATLLGAMLPLIPFRLSWGDAVAVAERIRARTRPGDAPGGPRAWAAMHRVWARGLYMASWNADAADAHLTVARLYEGAGLPLQAHLSRCDALNVATTVEDPAAAARALAALDTSRPAGPNPAAWELLARAGATHAFGGDPAVLDDLAIAATRASPRVSVEVTRILVTGLADLGRHREAVEWGRTQAARAAELGLPDNGLVIRNRLLRIASGRAEVEEAIEEARHLIGIAERYGAVMNLRALRRALVGLHLDLGDVACAEVALVALRDLERAHGATPHERAGTDLFAAEVAWSQGRGGVAVDLGRRAGADLAGGAVSRAQLAVGLRAARVLAASGEAEEARVRLGALAAAVAPNASPVLVSRLDGWRALTMPAGPEPTAWVARARARIPRADEAGILAFLDLAAARAAGRAAPALDPALVGASLELRMAGG